MVIKSRPYPDDERTGESLNVFLGEIEDYPLNALHELRRAAWWHICLRSLSLRELKNIIGHTDWMIQKQRKGSDHANTLSHTEHKKS
jgi:hypothetical protein